MFGVGSFVKHSFVGCCFLLLVLNALPAYATYTGLLIIPTAETVGADQYSVEYQYDGVIEGQNIITNFINTEIGIGNRIETGFDFGLEKDEKPFIIGNAKYLLSKSNEQALAVGVYGWGQNTKSFPYIVGLKDLGVFRFHFGGIRANDKNEWFVGADRTFDKWTLMADYTSGSGNFSSAGFYYQSNDRFGVSAGAVFTNDSLDSNLTMQFIYGASYR